MCNTVFHWHTPLLQLRSACFKAVGRSTSKVPWLQKSLRQMYSYLEIIIIY